MTKINWPGLDKTWNPITGCTACSPGCDHCYARRMAQRLKGRYGYPADDPFRVTFHEDKITQPLSWKKPRKVFVCSMSDLFHADVHINWIVNVFRVMMQRAPQHTYMILTKRPDRMDSIVQSLRGILYKDKTPDNVYLGVTVCNQQEANEKIPILLSIPATHRFVSIEPMLGPVDLISKPGCDRRYLGKFVCHECGDDPGQTYCDCCTMSTKVTRVERGLDLVILGGESGPKPRLMDVEWARNVKRQCDAAGVEFHMKQMSGRTKKERHDIPEDLKTKGAF